MSTEEFINRIKNNEMLYDKTNSGYSNIKEKENQWEILSKEYKCDAKKRWTSLRDRFVREKKKSDSAEPGTKYIVQWDYYDQMKFIDKHVKPRRSAVSFEPIFEETVIDEQDVKSFYKDFCMLEVDGLNQSEQQVLENSPKHSSCNISNNSIEEKVNIDQHEMDNESSYLVTLKKLQKQLLKICPPKEKDEDIFLQLVSNKIKKMSSNEKSNFQLEVLKKAGELITKRLE